MKTGRVAAAAFRKVMKSSSTGEFVAGRKMVSAAVESAPKALSFHIGKGNDAGVPRIEACSATLLAKWVILAAGVDDMRIE